MALETMTPIANRPEFDGADASVALAGLDALDVPVTGAKGLLARLWEGLWPKLLATALFFASWQVVVWTQWKPDYVLPGPLPALKTLWHAATDVTANGSHVLVHATVNTMRRAVIGYAMAVVLGVAVGLGVARSRLLRSAVGSMITGLQTMPTIAWLPLAVLLFKLTESAIVFVVVLGAAPAIANGVISGVDHIPAVLLRAGRVLGARGVKAYRFVVLPAALPGVVTGLKQGWAFAWRSLMAGELIVIIAQKPSLGVGLAYARELADAPLLMAYMLAVFVIGIMIDTVFFGVIERGIHRRWGLGGA